LPEGAMGNAESVNENGDRTLVLPPNLTGQQSNNVKSSSQQQQQPPKQQVEAGSSTTPKRSNVRGRSTR